MKPRYTLFPCTEAQETQKHTGFVTVCTQSRLASCELACPTANSDKESKWLKEKGGETATYIQKKGHYSKPIKGKSLDEGEERGLPSPHNK